MSVEAIAENVNCMISDDDYKKNIVTISRRLIVHVYLHKCVRVVPGST